ncbi:hypothetical protein OJ930_11800, partial [Streptococcus anginosus]|nr:hypothetical protein [Streptococcus anginosus]
MRRSKKYSRPVRPLNISAAMGGLTYENGRDGATSNVRRIASAAKDSVCPGCGGMIRVGES